MRENSDGKTVAAMDVLVPKIGEIIGGAQREERPDILEKNYVHLVCIQRIIGGICNCAPMELFHMPALA